MLPADQSGVELHQHFGKIQNPSLKIYTNRSSRKFNFVTIYLQRLCILVTMRTESNTMINMCKLCFRRVEITNFNPLRYLQSNYPVVHSTFFLWQHMTSKRLENRKLISPKQKNGQQLWNCPLFSSTSGNQCWPKWVQLLDDVEHRGFQERNVLSLFLFVDAPTNA